MMSPERVWLTLDKLAFERGLTPSGLAKAAGLDATTFNPSRRRACGEETYRWPSMKSLLAALAVLQMPFSAFAQMVEGGTHLETRRSPGVLQAPCLPLSRLTDRQLFTAEGMPDPLRWEHAVLPYGLPESAYCVRVDGYGLEPAVREGGLIIVAPDVPVRFSDRVLLVRNGYAPIVGIAQDNAQSVIQIVSMEGLAVREGESLALLQDAPDTVCHRIIMLTF